MKLQAHRIIDRAHVQDRLGVGLVDEEARALLPADLLQRLQVIEDSPR